MRLPIKGLIWASFDWARSPFYYVVIIYVFSTYFSENVAASSAQGQTIFSSTVTIAGLIMALLAPFLGGYMDRGGAKKPVLFGLIAILAISSAGLVFVTPGGEYSVPLAMVLMIICGCMYSVSELFHNALLPAVGDQKAIPVTSGLGLSLGSLASVVILLSMIYFMQSPPAGISSVDIARYSGVICAAWMVVFMLPFMWKMPDLYASGASWKTATFFPEQFRPIGATRELFSAHRNIMQFLMARMIFMDALTALFAIGAVYVAGVLGWSQTETAIMGVIATCAAVLGGFAGGFLDRTFGPKRAILIELFSITAIFCFQISFTDHSILFGLVQLETVQGEGLFNRSIDLIYLATIVPMGMFIIAAYSSCRTLLVFLSPPEKVGYFFGIYAMTSTVTVWLGPGLVTVVTLLSGDQRIGFGSLSILFVLGTVMMLFVREGETQKNS